MLSHLKNLPWEECGVCQDLSLRMSEWIPVEFGGVLPMTYHSLGSIRNTFAIYTFICLLSYSSTG